MSATVASMVNMGVDAPNSITSLVNRFKTSSSDNLAVITNAESDNPNSFKMVSIKAKK